MSTLEQSEMPVMLDHVDVRDLRDGMDVNQAFAVRSCERREMRDGKPWLRLLVGDRTGQIVVKVWPVRGSVHDEVGRVAELAGVGAVVRVRGTVKIDPEYGPEVKVEERDGRALVKLAAVGEFDPRRLERGPSKPLPELEAKFSRVASTVQDEHLSRLLDTMFRGDFWRDFKEAPAARGVHQAYRHGLLEHTVGVARTVRMVALEAALGPVDVDLAVTGALLHDVGKVDVYRADGMAIEMTTEGMLVGEIPLTLARVSRAIDALDGFPQDLRLRVLHVVAAHHGRVEWGATATPATREALLVHGVDLTAARLGAWDRLESERPAGAEWSGFERSLDGRAWFGPPEG